MKKHRETGVLFLYDIALAAWLIMYITQPESSLVWFFRFASIIILCVTYWTIVFKYFDSTHQLEKRIGKAGKISLIMIVGLKLIIYYSFVFINSLIDERSSIGIICGTMLLLDCFMNICVGKIINKALEKQVADVHERKLINGDIKTNRILLLYLISVAIVILGFIQLFLLFINDWGFICELFRLCLVVTLIYFYISIQNKKEYISIKRVYFGVGVFLLEVALTFVFYGAENNIYILVPACVISTIAIECSICSYLGSVYHSVSSSKTNTEG